jgi:hypothetical protein
MQQDFFVRFFFFFLQLHKAAGKSQHCLLVFILCKFNISDIIMSADMLPQILHLDHVS